MTSGAVTVTCTDRTNSQATVVFPDLQRLASSTLSVTGSTGTDSRFAYGFGQ